ncbi:MULTISPECIES: hypothetical protein [Methylorubrum]|uniref:hypothetical protein n=1 Tax=Methylorubrum TaxID=2282523 RepID=UPI00030C0A14|nr:MULTISPECIES: hypothetical protein [Methylorubrum]MCP1541950.1 G3E family GTPase [Methylorubrum extorquens]MCP1585513.1 G3E family GTPase [Methylorubrum extorquens]
MLSHYRAPGTVDAVNAADQIARWPEMAKQISAADRIVVSKGDLVTSARSLPAFAEAAL